MVFAWSEPTVWYLYCVLILFIIKNKKNLNEEWFTAYEA